MVDHSGWYPPGQVCYPPDLPPSFKNVHDLQPVVGVPSDEEMIGIHAIIHAANRVSGVPGMHDPDLFMKLADHLFNTQMARYRSKYSLFTFPSDATYTPPALPAHIPVSLEPISGSPSDEEIIKVQDAYRSYQELRTFPSMFDSHLNMELSQHLFDIQMARHMRLAGESQPRPIFQTTPRYEATTRTTSSAEDQTPNTNNAGMGGNITDGSRTPHLPPAIDALLERSNQLAERFNQLLERSNELMERRNQPNQQSNAVAEHFNQLFERFNQLVEASSQSAHRANELAERSNEFAERANQLSEQLNQSSERSDQLAKQASKPVERLGDLMQNINRVLVGIQHAIVRSHKGNTLYAVDCLVNEKGQISKDAFGATFGWLFENTRVDAGHHLPVRINGVYQGSRLHDCRLGAYLRFYGIGEGLRESVDSATIKPGKSKEAREMLSDYLSSCLG